MKRILFLALFVLVTLPVSKVYTATPIITFIPEKVMQGDPVMIVIENASFSEIKKVTLSGKLLKLFTYNNKPTALYGIDIAKKPGNYEIEVFLKNSLITKKTLVIEKRPKVEEVFSIPKKLGGDTTESQKALVISLQEENSAISKLATNKKIYWSTNFASPLKNLIVSDAFGYSRKTGGYTLIHKGTDFDAKENTQVFAMNDGLIKVAQTSRNYGNYIVIDHGLGVMTFYLHLSKMILKPGEMVKKGQLIGLSGQTGYAAGPHLHLSIRIYNVSIDPMMFMKIFK